ncbi:MAG: hypothetical protein R3B45_15790 [Bdellovibrionota bacterium]
MELKHLIFQASTAQEEQRYLSEFLIVVRANTDSCIRLKARPTAGLESEISGDAVNAEADVGPCEAYKTESTDESTAAEDSATDQQSASLLSLNYGSSSGGFSLTESTNLCDIRIFRMPSGQSTRLGQPSGLGPVVTKSARLAVISPGKKVKIWVDEEIGNICSSGSVGDFPITALGPLEQTNSSYAGHKDQLKVEHLTNLAAEVEKIYSTLTTTYGAISDLDTNGAVNLFISPDVNRQYFIPSRTNVADRFRATMIEKPEDLAYYNSTTNPLSNEGEVLYLWAPDPAGIFNYGLFPSGNSLTSNYAKGYLATQLMNLINHNSHLLTLKGKIEERWLREALAQLASAYVAGNDYTGLSLGHYLSSRPQEFSLTEPIGERIEADYKHYVRESQLGMRAMFGWFLHSKLCGGTSIAPCAKIKSLIATPKVGIANVEDILQMKFAEILKQFGLSVGVALADDPVSAAALVKNNTETPDPVLLPKLEFIFPSSPRKTFLVNYNVTASTTANDPALAGPFPSKDSMLFQPILPDNDMDLKLEKNSVTYILLSGIVNAETDITAYLGPNLNVTFVPLGERNGANRRIHMEKISEAAHLDLRPINLTSTAEADRTNYAPPSHAASYTVNYNREVWVMGSIDNFNINESGESKTVGDTDAYTIEVNPCEGATGADLTACQSQSYRSVIVQE